MITVILNAYKRTNHINNQVNAVKAQSIRPNEIILWQNNSSKNEILKLQNDIKHIYSSYNFGVWARFSAALNSKNEYVCVFDDDTIPGTNWLKNCLETIKKKNGLLGSRGVRFASKKKYLVGQEYGWNNPNDETKEVDIVGHSWFFKREWLSYFWRELPDFNKFTLVGEDIHFSYVLQKFLGINTYVPPHPKSDTSLWGSNKNIALKIGADEHAISYNDKRLLEMNQCYLEYLEKGFKPKFIEELKLKRIYLENKSNLGKYLKNVIKKK